MKTIENLIDRINTESNYRKVSYDDNSRVVLVKSGESVTHSVIKETEEKIIEFLDNYLKELFYVNRYIELCQLLINFSHKATGNIFSLTFDKDTYKDVFDNINLYISLYPINKDYFKDCTSDIAFEHAGNIIHIIFE